MILPPPRFDSALSLEQAIQARRSTRSFSDASVSLEHLAQLLWAGQGIISPVGLRTAPSAGATYPLELFVVAGNISELEAGTYQYHCQDHEISLLASGDHRQVLSLAALGQASIASAPFSLIVTAIATRTINRYGDRAVRYVAMEAGHAAQNIYLQATVLGLSTVAVGAFTDSEVRQIIACDEAEPFYIMPIGKTGS